MFRSICFVRSSKRYHSVIIFLLIVGWLFFNHGYLINITSLETKLLILIIQKCSFFNASTGFLNDSWCWLLINIWFDFIRYLDSGCLKQNQMLTELKMNLVENVEILILFPHSITIVSNVIIPISFAKICSNNLKDWIQMSNMIL